MINHIMIKKNSKPTHIFMATSLSKKTKVVQSEYTLPTIIAFLNCLKLILVQPWGKGKKGERERDIFPCKGTKILT
jgi:hypothetical protein